MERFVKGLFGFVGATIAWYLAAAAGQVAAFFASIVGIANRLSLHLFG